MTKRIRREAFRYNRIYRSSVLSLSEPDLQLRGISDMARPALIFKQQSQRFAWRSPKTRKLSTVLISNFEARNVQ
jgi:hypothetical protein